MFPTRSPTHKPTSSPSQAPTYVPTLSPTPAPTQFPTKEDGFVLVIVDDCDVYDGSASDDRFVIVVQEDCSVTLHGGLGRDVYAIGPSPKSIITITDFNITTDVIDLSQFKEFKSIRDVNMTRGSVRIHLPEAQLIVLTNRDPSDMRPEHFTFTPHDKTAEAGDVYVVAFIASLFLFMVCIGWHMCSMKVLEFDSFVERKQITKDPKSKSVSFDVEEGPVVVPPLNSRVGDLLAAINEQDGERSDALCPTTSENCDTPTMAPSRPKKKSMPLEEKLEIIQRGYINESDISSEDSNDSYSECSDSYPDIVRVPLQREFPENSSSGYQKAAYDDVVQSNTSSMLKARKIVPFTGELTEGILCTVSKTDNESREPNSYEAPNWGNFRVEGVDGMLLFKNALKISRQENDSLSESSSEW